MGGIGHAIGSGQVMIRAGFGRNLTTAPTFPLDTATLTVTYDQYVMDDAPVGYWRMSDWSGSVIEDRSIYDRHGTWYGGVTLGGAAAGPVAFDPHTAPSFDGTTGYGTVPNNITAGGDANLIIWFKTTQRSVPLLYDSGTWSLYIDGSNDIYMGATGKIAYSTDWTPGEWTAIRIEWHPSTGSAYVNGAQTHASLFAMDRPTGTTMYIGTDKTQSTFFSGNMAELALYNSYALVDFYGYATNTSTNMCNITDWVREWNCRRGRDYELDRIETGTASVTLDCTQGGLFYPENTSSPLYPEVVPMKLIQILYAPNNTAALDADWDSLFFGFIESYSEAWPGKKDETVTLRIAELSKILAMEHITLTELSVQDSGRVINDVLDRVYPYIPFISTGWPTSMRDIDVGKSQIQTIDVIDTPALSLIQQVAASERGLFFVSADGKAVFHNRHARITEFDTSSITLGDDIAGGEDSYIEVTAAFDDALLRNSVQITFLGQSPIKITDINSRKQYGERRYEASDLINNTPTEAEDMARWILARFKDPHLRITSITLYGKPSDSTAWEALLKPSTGDIATRITVKRRPANGDAISIDVHVDGVEHSGGPGWLRSSYSLTPADATTYWVWDSATNGLWDTSRWAY